jgi:integrase
MYGWMIFAGRHGILGMAPEDLDRKRHTITVRLKGARDEHRVPVTDDFWPLLDKYLSTERRTSVDASALWIAARKGLGKPLCYASFESSLRYIARKAGVSVHPHLFRHACCIVVPCNHPLPPSRSLAYSSSSERAIRRCSDLLRIGFNSAYATSRSST